MNTSASAPIGRLTTKIHRQVAYSANAPPSAGPRTAEMPQTLDSHPCTRPRSLRSYRSPATVLTVAPIDPAPSPCRPRNTMSDSMFQEIALSAEPMRNSMTPNSSTGLRPYRSASLP